MAEQSTGGGTLEYIREHSGEIARQIGDYGYIVADSLYAIVFGMLAVFLLHKLASKFLYPLLPNARLPRVVFGTLYVLVLVVTVLIALKRIGFDTSGVGPFIIVLVLTGAVVIYFLIPFLPRLPFLPGHTIETNGVMGTVDTISSFHTTLRRFDGTIVFLPNALIMASKILNYSYTPTRRIEMKLAVATDCDTAAAGERVVAVANADARVLAEPPPAVYAVYADASGVEMMLYCWVNNEDFLGTRSDLWLQLARLARLEEGIQLSVPKQEVHLRDVR